MKRLLAWLTLMLLCVWCMPTLGEEETHIAFRTGEGTIGTWWWNSTGLGLEETVGPRLEFLRDNQVSEIYLYAGPTNNKATLRGFIRRCGEEGIRVACLNGDASWIDPGSSGFVNWYRWFAEFQARGEEDERFYGIHLDVEPHQLSRYAAQEQICWQQYADFVAGVATQAHENGFVLELDIPFWLDGFSIERDGATESLLTFLAQTADTLCLMSYRDTTQAMFDTAKAEAALAEEYPVRLVLGAETLSCEGDFVSYMEEGKAYMVQELSALYDMLGRQSFQGGWGLAIHDIERWMQLKE